MKDIHNSQSIIITHTGKYRFSLTACAKSGGWEWMPPPTPVMFFQSFEKTTYTMWLIHLVAVHSQSFFAKILTYPFVLHHFSGCHDNHQILSRSDLKSVFLTCLCFRVSSLLILKYLITTKAHPMHDIQKASFISREGESKYANAPLIKSFYFMV